MKEAIEHIMCEPAYRLHLEANARDVFRFDLVTARYNSTSVIAGVRVSKFLSNPRVRRLHTLGHKILPTLVC